MTHICVYAICKNESAFVDRFMDSVEGADSIVVLDTGSTDDTVEKLQARGAIVHVQEISPWRFDVARNESMKLIPKEADLCLCLDLDEVITPGWDTLLRDKHVAGSVQQFRYSYIWDRDADGNPKTQIWYKKIHSNAPGFYWESPLHEYLNYTGTEPLHVVWLKASDLQVSHYPDPHKVRDYLPIIENGVCSEPANFTINYYYARELHYLKRHNDVIAAVDKALCLGGDNAHKAALMQFKAVALESLGHVGDAEADFIRAVVTVDGITREPLMSLMEFYYRHKRWYALIDAGERCLAIPYVPGAWYEDMNNYGYKPHDFMAIAYWNLGMMDKGREHINKALEYKPDDERLQANLKWFTGDLP